MATIEAAPETVEEVTTAETPAHVPVQARVKGAKEGAAKVARAGLGKVQKVTGKGMLDQVPPSVRFQIQYAKAGGWIPGEKASWLELLGKGYGFGVAVPVTALGFLLIWFVQRPTRLALGFVLWEAWMWVVAGHLVAPDLFWWWPL
jgi:hypothetical protein